MRAQVAKLGLAAVLAYGLFDGITYTSFFVLAFLGYEKSTGQNPAANLKALLGVSCVYLHITFWCFVSAAIVYALSNYFSNAADLSKQSLLLKDVTSNHF